MVHSRTPVQLSTGACRCGLGGWAEGHWWGLSLPLTLADIFSPRTEQGGLVGSDETVALTAFVAIALHHGLAVFQDKDSEQLKQRVVRVPLCLPSAGPQLSPFLLRNPGVQPPDTFLLTFL